MGDGSMAPSGNGVLPLHSPGGNLHPAHGSPSGALPVEYDEPQRPDSRIGVGYPDPSPVPHGVPTDGDGILSPQFPQELKETVDEMEARSADALFAPPAAIPSVPAPISFVSASDALTRAYPNNVPYPATDPDMSWWRDTSEFGRPLTSAEAAKCDSRYIKFNVETRLWHLLPSETVPKYANEHTEDLLRQAQEKARAIGFEPKSFDAPPPPPPPPPSDPSTFYRPPLPPPSTCPTKTWAEGVSDARIMFEAAQRTANNAGMLQFLRNFPTIYELDPMVDVWLNTWKPVNVPTISFNHPVSIHQWCRQVLALALSIDAYSYGISLSRDMFLLFSRANGLAVAPDTILHPEWSSSLNMFSMKDHKQVRSPVVTVWNADLVGWLKVSYAFSAHQRMNVSAPRAYLQSLYPFFDLGGSINENIAKSLALWPFRATGRLYDRVKNGAAVSLKVSRRAYALARVLDPKQALADAAQAGSTLATTTVSTIRDSYDSLTWIDGMVMGLPWAVMIVYIFKERLHLGEGIGPIIKFAPSLALFGQMFSVYRWYDGHDRRARPTQNDLYNSLYNTMPPGFVFVSTPTFSQPPAYGKNDLFTFDEEISWHRVDGTSGIIVRRNDPGAIGAQYTRVFTWWDLSVHHSIFVIPSSAYSGIGSGRLVNPLEDLTVTMHPALFYVFLTWNMCWARFQRPGLMIAIFWALSVPPLYFMWKYPRAAERFFINLFKALVNPSKWPLLFTKTVSKARARIESAAKSLKRLLKKRFRFESSGGDSYTVLSKVLMKLDDDKPLPLASVMLIYHEDVWSLPEHQWEIISDIMLEMILLDADMSEIFVRKDASGDVHLDVDDYKLETMLMKDSPSVSGSYRLAKYEGGDSFSCVIDDESSDSDSDEDEKGRVVKFEARRGRHKSSKKGKGKNRYKKRAKAFKWKGPSTLKGKTPHTVEQMYKLLDSLKNEDNPNDPYYDFVAFCKDNHITRDIAKHAEMKWNEKDAQWEVDARFTYDDDQFLDERYDLEYGEDYDHSPERTRVRHRRPGSRREDNDWVYESGRSPTPRVALLPPSSHFEAPTQNPPVHQDVLRPVRDALWLVCSKENDQTFRHGYAVRYVDGFITPRHVVMEGLATLRKGLFLLKGDVKLDITELSWSIPTTPPGASEPIAYGIPKNPMKFGKAIKFSMPTNVLEKMVFVTDELCNAGDIKIHGDGSYCSYNASTDVTQCGGVILVWNNNAWVPLAVHNKTDSKPMNGEHVNSGLIVNAVDALFRKRSGPPSAPSSSQESSGGGGSRQSVSGAQRPIPAGTSQPMAPDKPGSQTSQ